MSFINEYVVNPNATRAAIRAGYSKKSAPSIGSRLLARPDIQMILQEVHEDPSLRKVIARLIFIAELEKVAFSDISDFIEWGPDGIVLNPSVYDRNQNAAVAHVSTRGPYQVRLRLHDKVRALDLLARHYGLYPK